MYNVLVCDDDREIVEAIEIYLSQEGYKVLKAYDGEEALKVLDREKVDLLIIDCLLYTSFLQEGYCTCKGISICICGSRDSSG